jgi:hypothetical protein
MYDMAITVKKDELLGKLRENREKHRTVFEAAMTGYEIHCRQVLGEHLAAIHDGRLPEIRIIISRPEDHTRDYDRVIGMLSMHTGDVFDLDEQMYQQYVDDDWSWKTQWVKMSNSYAPEATSRNYTVGD